MKTSSKSFLARASEAIALTLLAVLLCLSLLEAGLRLFAGDPNKYVQATDETLFWQYDSLLGWSMRSNAAGRFIRPEFTATVQTNAFGLRDDNFPLQKPDGELRILLLGDSVVAGFEVDRQETLEARLETWFNARRDGKVYQVINAGFRGYGTDQELLFLQHRGLAFQPDAVVLAFVPANDLENNVTVHAAGRKYAKPFFDYAPDSTLILRGVPVPAYAPNSQVYSPVLPQSTPKDKKVAGRPGALKKFLSRRLYSYAFLARRLKNLPPGMVSRLQQWGILQRTVPAEWVDFYRDPVPLAWQARWQLTFDLLREMKRLCDLRQIPFIVWMFPLKEQVYDRDREIFVTGYGLKEGELNFDLPAQQLAQFCRAMNIAFLSPLPRFRSVARSGQRLHFLSDNHFNAAGHALMADLLYPILFETMNSKK